MPRRLAAEWTERYRAPPEGGIARECLRAIGTDPHHSLVSDAAGVHDREGGHGAAPPRIVAARRLEEESTFDLTAEQFRAVRDALEAQLGRPAARASGATQVRARRPRVRIVFYLPPASAAPEDVLEWTDRLTIDVGPAGLRARSSAKCWARDAGHARKYHCEDRTLADMEEATAMLMQRPQLLGALVKFQFRFGLRHQGEEFALSLDAMVPFEPAAAVRCAAAFHHFEVESRGALPSSVAVAVLRSLGIVAASLPPISLSKRALSAPRSPTSATIDVRSGDELTDLVHTACLAAAASVDAGDLLAGARPERFVPAAEASARSARRPQRIADAANSGTGGATAGIIELPDLVERECKFDAAPGFARLFDLVRSALPPELTVVQWLPRTMIDIYFDDPARTLLASRSGMRLRRRQRSAGWSATFKPSPSPGRNHTERVEICSKLDLDRAVAWLEGRRAGRAAIALEGWLRERGADGAAVSPILVMMTYRRGLMVRERGTTHFSANMLDLFVDDVTAIDAAAADLRSLVASDFVEWAHGPREGRFRVLEIECAGRALRREAESFDLMLRTARTLEAAGARRTPVSKYAQAMARLRIDLGVLAPDGRLLTD